MSDPIIDENWRARPLLPIKMAANIAGVSPASLYRAQTDGSIEFKRLAGRTLVTTQSLVAMIDGAEPWTPSDRGAHGRAARTERARAAWAE
ncbi:hypothetical protein [Pelagibacterium sp.]|uniref:hypothetical protein n=1 Tax=Pelagibacterium sp. TaxID=1967288 RepID=UPI003A90FEF1